MRVDDFPACPVPCGYWVLMATVQIPPIEGMAKKPEGGRQRCQQPVLGVVTDWRSDQKNNDGSVDTLGNTGSIARVFPVCDRTSRNRFPMPSG